MKVAERFQCSRAAWSYARRWGMSFWPSLGQCLHAWCWPAWWLRDGGADIRRIQVMNEALQRIERWFGEFPEVPDRDSEGRPNGKTIPYGWAYGSNGERDFMRTIARNALNYTGKL